MFSELKPALAGRYAVVFNNEFIQGQSRAVKLFEGVVSNTEKFGYTVYAPISVDRGGYDAITPAKGVRYVQLDPENIMNMTNESSTRMTIMLARSSSIRVIEDIDFKLSEDPLKKLEDFEKMGNHMVFAKFFLDVELSRDTARMPTRANHDDAGLDVYSPADYIIPPRGDVLIPTGLKTHFPKGYALVFKEKSGRATKNKLDLGACLIDSGYQGEVHVHLFNNSDIEVKISTGEKISQLVAVPVWHGIPRQVDKIERETTRGAGGFGSTGLK